MLDVLIDDETHYLEVIDKKVVTVILGNIGKYIGITGLM